jgi:hypothetical protein
MEYEEYSQEGGAEEPPVYFAGNYLFTPAQVKHVFGEGNERLAYDYFKNPWTVENLRIPKEDKKKVLQIIDEKILGLTWPNNDSKQSHSIKERGVLINARPLGIVQELELLKSRLIHPKQRPLTEEEKKEELTLKKIEELSTKQLFTILYENAWWLLHPRDVPSDVREAWLKILEQNKKPQLDILLELLDKNQIEGPKNQLKTFMDLDVAKPVIQKPTIESAAAVTAGSFGSGPRDLQAKLQMSLEKIFKVFGTLGFMSNRRVKTITSTIKGKTTEALDEAINGLPKELSNKFLRSMDPIYKYYETQYGEAYTLLKTFMEKKFNPFQASDKNPVNFPLNAALIFLERSNRIRQELEAKRIQGDGLVRLTDLSDEVKDGMKNILEKFTGYMNGKVSVYQNTAIKTVDNPSNKLYTLMSGIDQYTIQFISPTVSVPPAQFKQALTGKSGQEKVDLTATVTKFFEKSSSNFYLMIQPRIGEGGQPKDLRDIKPALYELPESSNKDSLKNFSSLATTNTFKTLNISASHTEFVQSITDRSLALMVLLYFRLMLEKASSSTIKSGVPVVDATATTATTTATAERQGTANTGPKS